MQSTLSRLALVAAVAVTMVLVAAAAAAVFLHYGADGTPAAWPSTVEVPRDGDAPPGPLGQPPGAWAIVFGDEFDGTELDRSRWDDRSSAESDEGRGNKGNQQLEWNQAANCRVGGGELVMTARRERHESAAGERYDWTSCLIASTPSLEFQHGYIEERAILPSADGFWPAFWTWQAAQVDRQVETDVYEQYSAGSRELQMTQHSGSRGGCTWKLPFDPSADWHTYGVAIEASGTVWYVDGIQVCRTTATADGPTNVISNLAVYGDDPPAAGTRSADKRVDYIRAWTRA
jgi:beta-glucanase (GH16 family)